MKNIFQKNNLILGFGLVLLSAFIIIAGVVFLAQRQLLIDARKENLQIIANEKALLVNSYLEFLKEKVTIIASMDVFKEAVLNPNDPIKIKMAKVRINEINDVIPRIAIFTNKGIMFIAESGPVPVDYSTLPYFVSKDKKVVFVRYYDNFQKRDYYSILGPIYDNTENKIIIGSIAFDVELDKVSTLMKEALEIINGEVYLIDETGLLLSDSKYITDDNKNGVLIQEAKSDGAKMCLEDVKKYRKDSTIEGHEEQVLQYRNYMGDKVFGAHSYVPSIMGCVVAEESTGEVMGISTGDYIKNIFSKNEVKK